MALQLSVLQQKKQVINLSARAVLQFMEEQPFAEVCIFACFEILKTLHIVSNTTLPQVVS